LSSAQSGQTAVASTDGVERGTLAFALRMVFARCVSSDDPRILALAFDNAFDIAIASPRTRALIDQTAKQLNSEFTIFTDDGELGKYERSQALPSSTMAS
jgi:hypothetical protein